MSKCVSIKNTRGSIILLAVAVIAAMSVTAAMLTVATILEIKKTANIERAALSRYKAESGIENSLFILRKAFIQDPPKSIAEIKTYFGFNDLNNFSEIVACSDVTPFINSNCEKLEVKFGVSNLRFDLTSAAPLVLDFYEPGDKDSPPSSGFLVNKIVWTDAGVHQYEISFIPWNVVNPLNIEPLTPIKRLVEDNTPVSAGGDGLDNDIVSFKLPCDDARLEGEDYLCAFESDGLNPDILSKVRIRLLGASTAYNLNLSLYYYDGFQDISDCNAIDGWDQCIPGFFEIISTGKDAFNKQALRIVSSVPSGEDQTSDIWDYAIFSHGSLSK